MNFDPYELRVYYAKSKPLPAAGESFQTKLVKTTISPTGILVVSFCTPQKLNSMTFRAVLELFITLEHATRDPRVKVMVLTGEGRAFTAGANIGDIMSKLSIAEPKIRDLYLGYCDAGKGHVSYKGVYEDDFAMAGLILRLLEFPKPLFAAVNGLAIGMGTTMLPYFDYVVAWEGSQFRMPFSLMGISPELGSSIVMTQFRNELVFATPFNAQRALNGGLIHEVSPTPEGTVSACVKLATELIADNRVPGIECCKRIHNFRQSNALERENDVINKAMASDYAREQLMRTQPSLRQAKM